MPKRIRFKAKDNAKLKSKFKHLSSLESTYVDVNSKTINIKSSSNVLYQSNSCNKR